MQRGKIPIELNNVTVIWCLWQEKNATIYRINRLLIVKKYIIRWAENSIKEEDKASSQKIKQKQLKPKWQNHATKQVNPFVCLRSPSVEHKREAKRVTLSQTKNSKNKELPRNFGFFTRGKTSKGNYSNT